jgi:hypothetical protein
MIRYGMVDENENGPDVQGIMAVSQFDVIFFRNDSALSSVSLLRAICTTQQHITVQRIAAQGARDVALQHTTQWHSTAQHSTPR